MDPSAMATPPPPPALVGDLVEEILIRFPPDDPALLVRAALVCKPWCRLVSGRGFRRRFREFHRVAPVLGLLCNFRDKDHLDEDVVRFVPTASFPPTRSVHRNWRAVDARHGRVLLRSMYWDCDDLLDGEFVVWDPIAKEEQWLPALPRYPDSWNVAVLCAASLGGACDHLDCHRGPFLVVVVDTEAKDMFVHVYSSEAGVWSEQTCVQRPKKNPAHWLWPSVLVGNALYFMLRPHKRILKYNVCTLETSVIDLPLMSHKPNVLTTTEDGRLGFATLRKSRLYLWSREASREGDSGWKESRVIELENLFPVDALLISPTVVGFADGVGTIFVGTHVGVFAIDLKSRQVKNVCMTSGENIVPYMSFYTPAWGATWVSTCEGPSMGAST